MARAGVVVQDYWSLGEHDSGIGTTVDSVGGVNLTASGSPVSTSTTAPGSTAARYFNGSSGYSGSSVLGSTVDNFGIVIWADPTSNANGAVFYNGNTGSSGWGIYQCENLNWCPGSGSYWALLFGAGPGLQEVPVALNTYTELALVRDSGVATFYVNGVAVGSTTSFTPFDPAGNVMIGFNPAYSGESYVGNLDEARIFTFAPGQFSPADLNYSPEPSSLALVGLGAIALAGCVRRRKAVR